jgi:DNA-binding transcriptional LysR family regulator
MKISLDALELLDAIELRGSFAAAAQALHRVPSAITHAVRKLEDDLGVELFVREGRRAQLTAAGRTLLEEGRQLLRSAGELECRVKRVATGWENELSLAVDASLDLSRLFPLIEEFDQATTGTRLRINREVLGGCWDALLTGRADLAIGAPGDAPPGERWTLRPLGHGDFVFVVAPHHPLATVSDPITTATLAPFRVVALADTSRQLLARTAGLGLGPATLTVNDPQAKCDALVAGLGVGHLPRWLAQREVTAGRLVIKSLEELSAPIPVHLAWRSGHEGKALAWFVERLSTDAWRQHLTGEKK